MVMTEAERLILSNQLSIMYAISQVPGVSWMSVRRAIDQTKEALAPPPTPAPTSRDLGILP